MRVLVVEDDPHLGPSIKQRLESQQFAVDWLDDGADALVAAQTVAYDVMILDVMLPSMDGFLLCRALRNAGLFVPILLLTALGEVEQRVSGLDAGADDYLCKPFAFSELEARVRALVRRGTQDRSLVLQIEDLRLDPRTHEVWRGARPIILTGKEFGVLEFLMRHPRHVISRAMLVEHVWDFTADHLSNVIEVFIANLRRKLCAEGEPDLIHTIRGSGYQIREPQA